MAEITKDDLIGQVKAVAQRLGRESLSMRMFVRETGVSEWHVYKHFDTWNELVSAAGLTPIDTSAIPEDELWQAMYEAFMSEEKVVTIHRFRRVCRFSLKPYKKLGRWESILAAFRLWVQKQHPDFPYINQLPVSDGQARTETTDVQNNSAKASPTRWQSTGGRLYGPILNFRGLQHAPINEQGVVLLFGMVAFELGFIVESVATGYPDCEAKRRVSGRNETWERIRIEFEFQSRNFKDQGHDPSQCDLIVCWEDNWSDSPLEVLELKSEITDLES